MSSDKELDERIRKNRELKKRRRPSARGAIEQADELDEILAISRAEHDGAQPSRPLRSASELMGPGGRQPPARRELDAVDTESAYDRNLAAARFAAPDAFSRSRTRTVLGPGAPSVETGLRPHPDCSIQRPGQPGDSPAIRNTKPTPENAAPASVTRDETTLIVRQRKTARLDGDAPRPQTAPIVPQAALDDRGRVVPTDHIATLPGARGRVDATAKTHVGNAPKAHASSLQANTTNADPNAVAPTDHVPTAPGIAGLERVTTTERTEVVRLRRLHPDAVDPENGEVLPTDHVITAPGLAGIKASPTERTMPRIEMPPFDPMTHGETAPIAPASRTASPRKSPKSTMNAQTNTPAADAESTLVIRERKSPATLEAEQRDLPDSPMVVHKRRPPD